MTEKLLATSIPQYIAMRDAPHATGCCTSSIYEGKARNILLDFFRGYALWCISIDHVPGNVISAITLGHLGVCDAAEVFVFIAGASAGYAYNGTFAMYNKHKILIKLLRRIGSLYLCHVVMSFLVFTELLVILRGEAGKEAISRMGLLSVADLGKSNVLDWLMLRCHPGLLMVLPLYIGLLTILAGAVYLFRQINLLMLFSVLLYVLAQIIGYRVVISPDTVEYFDPLAWQLLFFIGLFVTTAQGVNSGNTVIWDVTAVLISVLGLTLHLLSYVFRSGPIVSASMDVMSYHSKAHLHPLRLANVLAWVWLVWRLEPIYGRLIELRVAKPILTLGRNSLRTFCTGVVLAPIGSVVVFVFPSVLGSVLWSLAATLAMVVIATCAPTHLRLGQATRAAPS